MATRLTTRKGRSVAYELGPRAPAPAGGAGGPRFQHAVAFKLLQAKDPRDERFLLRSGRATAIAADAPALPSAVADAVDVAIDAWAAGTPRPGSSFGADGASAIPDAP